MNGTPEHRMARAHRASAAWDEFFAPMVANMKDEYAARIIEIAATELSRDKRTDKITSLSTALKILAALDSGMREYIRDGDLARADKLRATEIERLSAPKRRLLSIAAR